MLKQNCRYDINKCCFGPLERLKREGENRRVKMSIVWQDVNNYFERDFINGTKEKKRFTYVVDQTVLTLNPFTSNKRYDLYGTSQEQLDLDWLQNDIQTLLLTSFLFSFSIWNLSKGVSIMEYKSLYCTGSTGKLL